jgi:hypothetical protein
MVKQPFGNLETSLAHCRAVIPSNSVDMLENILNKMAEKGQRRHISRRKKVLHLKRFSQRCVEKGAV